MSEHQGAHVVTVRQMYEGGPWRLFIGAVGVADWPSVGAEDVGPQAYAEDVARCVRMALARPDGAEDLSRRHGLLLKAFEALEAEMPGLRSDVASLEAGEQEARAEVERLRGAGLGADVEAIRSRCEAATPGPWAYWFNSSGSLVGPGYDSPRAVVALSPGRGNMDADAAFIAAARSDIPALLALAAERTRERDALHVDAARLTRQAAEERADLDAVADALEDKLDAARESLAAWQAKCRALEAMVGEAREHLEAVRDGLLAACASRAPSDGLFVRMAEGILGALAALSREPGTAPAPPAEMAATTGEEERR